MFWFNANHGTDDTVFCSKVVKVIREDTDRHKKIFLVELDSEGAIPKKPRKDPFTGKETIVMKVSREEGEVWKRWGLSCLSGQLGFHSGFYPKVEQVDR